MKNQHHFAGFWRAQGRMWLMALVAALFVVAPQSAKADGKTEKQYRKECKKEAKRLEKEGWKAVGTAQPIEELLVPYYMAVDSGASHIVELQTGPNINLVMRKAQTAAQARYAADIETSVKAQTETEMVNVISGDSVRSEERFRATSQAKTQQLLRKFAPRFTLTRETEDGKVEVMQFYTYQL